MAEKNKTGNYVEALDPKGYVSNGEISAVDGRYLVKGSQNTIIKRSGRTGGSRGSVATRGGYTLKGDAKTMNRGIETHYDWKMNNGIKRNIRGYYNRLEVWYNDSWEIFQEGLTRVGFNWAEIWNNTAQIDVLLGVNGTNSLYEWSGGVATVASVTSNTITKQKYVTGTTYSFTSEPSGNDTISDTGSGFVTAGFAVGDEIVVSGSTSNDGTYTITAVAAGVITLADDDTLTNEAAGDTVIIKDSVEGTWAMAHFFTGSTRKVYIDGTEYTYTGGESTGTLTGVTPDPSAGGVVGGDVAIQSMRTYASGDLGSAWGASYNADVIGVIYNYAVIGSNSSRVVYMSKDTDYTNFAFSAPRTAGEGFEFVIDAAPTSITPDEDYLFISAGEDLWYKISFKLNADQDGETVVIDRLKTATGQAALNQGAVIQIKNNVAFLSFEGTIDTLGNIENIATTQSVPISDDIKDDLDSYDLTGAHGLYYERAMYIAIPRESIMLIYDVRYEYWQPPQIMAFSRMAVIDNSLCAHSSTSNETYTLNDGYTDNGAAFDAIAAFGYDNFGAEFDLKQCDELATVVKLSSNTELTNRMVYDYKGAGEIREFTISGSDSNILFNPNPLAGLGRTPLGSAPLGGMAADTSDLAKARAIDETPLLDFFERQRVFYTNQEAARWEILGYGENVMLSDNEPTFIRR